MSFTIAVHVNEGIVLASDRRTTYTNTETVNNRVIQRIGIHTTNSSDKTFVCPNGAGISISGQADLLGKPITGFIQDMIRTRISADLSIAEIPNRIFEYFRQYPIIPDTTFVVAGYLSKQQVLYRFNLKDVNSFETIDTNEQGAIWSGEILTLVRLLHPMAEILPNGEYNDLPNEAILWNYFTLQDAIDFARYSVETTIQTMRFKNVIETVGGSVDILVITPDETKWLQKETLK